jgi:subtilisin family serine protease
MAWDVARGAGVKVAVVDSGVEVSHRDLAGQFAAGTPGYDFQDGQVAQRIDGGSHATHVAGIIAATSGNGIGTAGVAPEAAIVPVQVLDNATDAGTVATAYAGLDFAASQPGVRVVNVSLSARNGAADVLCEPIARHPDVLFVTSAGNSGVDTSQTPVFPASCPQENVISVGASTRLDQRATFSNYGATVDLFAPGEGILSLALGGGDTTMSGTSMAAPFVSGVAALVFSARPELAPAAVRQAITSSVDPVPALAGVSVSGGRLNAYAALLAAGATPMTVRRTSAWHALPAPVLRFPSGTRLKLCARGSTTRGCRKVRTRSGRLAPTMRGTVHLSLRRLGQAAAANVKIDKLYAVKGSAATDAVDFVVRTSERGRRLRPGRYRLTAVQHTRFGVTAPARTILKVAR